MVNCREGADPGYRRVADLDCCEVVDSGCRGDDFQCCREVADPGRRRVADLGCQEVVALGCRGIA